MDFINKSIRSILLFIVIITLSGCSNSNNKNNISEEKEYRTEFTPEELEQGKAEFEIADNLKMCGSVTKQEKYKDGLSSYYMLHYYDKGDADNVESDNSDMYIYGKPRKEFFDWLADFIDGEYDSKDMEWNIDTFKVLLMHFTSDNGWNYNLIGEWSGDNEIFDVSKLYYPTIYFRVDEGINQGIDIGYGNYLRKYLEDAGGELDFGSISDVGQEMKEILEGYIGRQISDVWDCVTVNKENIQQVNEKIENDKYETEMLNTENEEYYEFSFYFDVDGLPYERLGLSYELKEGETCTPETRWASDGTSLLHALDEVQQTVSVCKNGILCLDTSYFRYPGEAYKESQKIITPSEILAKIEDYYSTKLLVKPITVTDVRLVYGSYFTDTGDGIIDNAICPYWKVTVYDEADNYNKEFIYDAVSGNEM